jgi:hypothetical protein
MTHAIALTPSLPGGTAIHVPVLWGIADVREARPDLNPRQAWEVLKLASSEQDTRIGATWSLLMHAAEALFGPGATSSLGE